jgi:dihydroxyacetone kinase-like protein
MGIALSSCTVPIKGSPTFDLGDNEIEVGIGIHGEPGRERISMENADAIVDRLVLSIIEDQSYKRFHREWDEANDTWAELEIISESLKTGDRVITLVNGMGGTPLSELYIVFRRLSEICEQKGLKIVRKLIGNYVTSLEMQGCSITLLKVDDELIQLWDAPVKTPSLNWRP